MEITKHRGERKALLILADVFAQRHSLIVNNGYQRDASKTKRGGRSCDFFQGRVCQRKSFEFIGNLPRLLQKDSIATFLLIVTYGTSIKFLK